MNSTLMINYENKPAYEIHYEPDFSKLSAALTALGMKSRRLMIITECNVGKLYLEELKQALGSVSNDIYDYTFPAGEASKNLDTVSKCYEQLILSGFDRNDVLIALGGGVVGDLTGFVAATYLRGIRFIQVPTSLLSMVDSSIGGKTGVDFKAYKNMVGAFHQPKLVYMNLNVLKSLPNREYLSGMGEIIKHGLIKNHEYFNWLKQNDKGIINKDYEILKEMILQSNIIKKRVVEADPKEQGDRALLNFGHTIGHSVEKLMDFKLLHGECVSLGMVAASYLSMKRGFLSASDHNEIVKTIQLYQQPIKVKGLAAKNIYEVTKLDKKMDSNKIKFILLENMGHAMIDPTVTEEEMLDAIEAIMN